ncbi:MAG: hypothetical protein JMN27_13380 [gamma proteobacterium endosymbiont of Lamellibrachia anaximandri]|nr:hypothetical protein [gamma proteobacterium endosymbiont of Lamellibrachia anaximandri]MBL3534806.1 hypothetical protein [gamma proteobacterium endosymbiont of Lamellibrachia anaximandri]
MTDQNKSTEPETSDAVAIPDERLVMPDFGRELRYMVIKLKDAETALTETELSILKTINQKIDYYRTKRGKEWLKCVVVEHDWPEYEPTWKAIEERVKSEELKCPRCASPDEDFGEA